MRAFALFLLLLNVLALAWWHGLWGSRADGAERQRLAAQVAPERLRLLSAAELEAARERARRSAAAPAGIDFSGGPVCLELGDFAAPGARELRARAAALGWGERLVLRELASPGWTLVVLPPARSRAEAERQLATARQQGADEAWVIDDRGPLQWAVALGAFRTGEAARVQAAALERRGLKAARVVPAPATVPALRLRIEAADAAQGEALAALARDFPGSRLEPCAP